MINPINVLIVDDHPVVLSGLSSALSTYNDIVIAGQASDAAEALIRFEKLQPDLVLIDLSLPDIDGIELLQMLRRKSPQARFVVLTARTSGDDINRALEHGAQAYLFKGSSTEDIVSAIRIVAQGGRFLPPSVGRIADQRPLVADLTTRERQIVIALARGFSTAKISAALKVSPDTVKSHVRNILEKLDLASRSEAVAFCLRTGMIRLEDI